MPKNTTMFSNQAAFEEGYNRVIWKNNLVNEYFKNINYSLDKASAFDHREIIRLISLIVDMSVVANEPENLQREYFNSQIKDIEENFILSNDPATKLPYIKRMYECAATTYDIDWNNPAEIDNLLCSVASQQMLGTVMERMPAEVMSIFPTKDDVKKLDNISISNFAHMLNMQNYLLRHNPDINRGIGVGHNDTESFSTRISTPVFLSFVEATKNGSNVAMFDPTKLDILKKHFLGDTFTIHYDEPVFPNDPTNTEVFHMTYESDEASKDFLAAINSVWSGTLNELLTVKAAFSESERSKLLFINGKSVFDIVSEKISEENLSPMKANIAAGNMLRDAMTDGKSIVSLMRPNITEGGKVSFTHQEIKADLDELNKVERNEKHNIFRRALDFIGIWKITPKFPSNAARDEQQKATRIDSDYQKSLTNAEKEFIKSYNEKSKAVREAEEKAALTSKKPISRDKFYQLYPEIRADENEYENVNENELDNNDKNFYRVQLPPIKEVLEEADEIDINSPINDVPDRSLSIDNISK